MPDSVTQIRTAGPVGSKRNLAIVGDGFAAGDQNAYNDFVQNVLLGGVFANDYFYEDASAWNIFRVNLISTDSGVSHRTYDASNNIISDSPKNTALGMIFTGQW